MTHIARAYEEKTKCELRERDASGNQQHVCSSLQTVTILSVCMFVSENKLTGMLPPELGAAWPAMEDLELNTNAFTGPLPKEWSKMGKLKMLHL